MQDVNKKTLQIKNKFMRLKNILTAKDKQKEKNRTLNDGYLAQSSQKTSIFAVYIEKNSLKKDKRLIAKMRELSQLTHSFKRLYKTYK